MLFRSQLFNPGHCIALAPLGRGLLLKDRGAFYNGIQTGDYPRFGRSHFELPDISESWTLQQSTVEESTEYGGCSKILLWEDGAGSLVQYVREKLGGSTGAWLRGQEIWGRKGILVSAMRDLPCSLYTGQAFDDNSVAIIPGDDADLAALLAYCSSAEYSINVRKISPALKVRGPLVEVPFEAERWADVASIRYPNGLPCPYSDDPTQWLFHGHPRPSTEPLQVAVARLLGYQWPVETGHAAGLLGDDGLEWANRSSALADHADNDGIVCLPAVRGESAAHQRLRALLASAFAEGWESGKERELLLASAVANGARKPEANLEDWLKHTFFIDHCRVFQNRPFIWQVWDGNPNGFSALVNYHKLAAPNGQGHKTLE